MTTDTPEAIAETYLSRRLAAGPMLSIALLRGARHAGIRDSELFVAALALDVRVSGPASKRLWRLPHADNDR